MMKINPVLGMGHDHDGSWFDPNIVGAWPLLIYFEGAVIGGFRSIFNKNVSEKIVYENKHIFNYFTGSRL